MGAKLQKDHSTVYSNDNLMMFNKGGTGIRICRKVKSEYDMSTIKQNDFERMGETN